MKACHSSTAVKVLCSAFSIASLAPACHGQSVKARVKPYRVAPNLNNVTNAGAVRKTMPISPSQIALLRRNGFVAAPTNAPQIFQIYEENDYKNIPSFVAVDGVLQLYHIFYDSMLRQVETSKLSPALQKLTEGMLNASISDWNAARDAKLKAAAMQNVAFFGVADRMLGGTTGLPDGAQKMVTQELAQIRAHNGFGQSAIFPYKIDYSQFIARGHYTRTPTLSKYFGAMMWFGLVPFSMRTDGRLNEAQIRQGLLWVRGLYRSGQAANWATIYEPTSFFVGASDDLTPRDWKTVSDRIFGAQGSVNDFADAAKFNRFVREMEQAAKPKIAPRFARQMGVPKGTPNVIEGPLPSGPQLRFMGQRYIPDSEIMQRLSMPIARVFPTGLDVMAVLGSARARSILDANPNLYNPRRWSGYNPERTKLTRQFAALPTATWNSNLYYGWLYALKALLEPVPAGYPPFMRNAAWNDKSVHTALASWSQLRHDTILYGKQSVVESGGGEDAKPFVKGYVEPNVLFYDRLLKLTQASRIGLQKRRLLESEVAYKFSEFESLLSMLKRISIKELGGQKLTKEEYEEIRYIGGKWEYMTLSVMANRPSYWQLVSQTDRDMATVADVHTGDSQALEVGVGRAMQMWVVVPIEGKLSLTRGAIFSFYEWKQPISNRLTDEKWQAMLRGGTNPPPPPWTKSFVSGPKPKQPTSSQYEDYTSG